MEHRTVLHIGKKPFRVLYFLVSAGIRTAGWQTVGVSRGVKAGFHRGTKLKRKQRVGGGGEYKLERDTDRHTHLPT